MATSSRSRPSGAVSHASRGPATLPSYQPLANPLNQDAINALHSFTRTYPLAPLTKRQDLAISSLSNIAADVNERYTARSVGHQRQTAKRLEHGEEEDENQAAKVEKLGQDTKELTSMMEEAVRGVVDSKAYVEGLETALRELDTNVRDGNGRLAPTQSTLGASQFRGQKRRRRIADGEDDPDDDEPTQTTQQEGPTSFLQRKLETSSTEYERLSQKDKYASNNDYIGFRKCLHDAQHPGDDAPPMPHASTWFRSATAATTDVAASESDEDVQVASEKRSIRCPITLLPMKDPITSTKCPHSFEKEAIHDMLKASSLTVSGGPDAQTHLDSSRRTGGAQKAVKCPECQVVLTAQNLKADAALIRKIRRIQAAEQDARDEDSDPEPVTGRRRGTQRQHIGSSPGPATVGGGVSQSQRIKKEMAEARSRGVSMVPGTQLGGEGEGEDDSYEMVGETQIEGSEDEGEAPSGTADVISMDEDEEEDDEEGDGEE